LIQCLKEVITVFINEAKDEGTFELRPDAVRFLKWEHFFFH